MGQIKSKIDCCGSNFENKNISLMGLVTLSVPLIVLSSVCFLITLPLRYAGPLKRINSFFHILFTANYKLVDNYNLYPSLRCSIAAFFSKLSPKLYKFTYNNFNLCLLSLFWVSLGLGVSFIV